MPPGSKFRLLARMLTKGAALQRSTQCLFAAYCVMLQYSHMQMFLIESGQQQMLSMSCQRHMLVLITAMFMGLQVSAAAAPGISQGGGGCCSSQGAVGQEG